MLQITKLSGLAAASVVFLFVSACTEKTVTSDSETTASQKTESHPELRNEIQKLLREEKHDPKILRDSLRGMTWEEAKPIWEEEKKNYEKQHGKDLKRETFLIAGLEIQGALSEISIENSRRQRKEALEELDRGLKEMAEKEGRMK